MAEAFPNSEFVGIDFHEPSIAHARRHTAGLGNVRFETSRDQDFAGSNYDLVTIFDALHDMGDPARAEAPVREAPSPEGTLLPVEQMAGDRKSVAQGRRGSLRVALVG